MSGRDEPFNFTPARQVAHERIDRLYGALRDVVMAEDEREPLGGEIVVAVALRLATRWTEMLLLPSGEVDGAPGTAADPSAPLLAVVEAARRVDETTVPVPAGEGAKRRAESTPLGPLGITEHPSGALIIDVD